MSLGVPIRHMRRLLSTKAVMTRPIAVERLVDLAGFLGAGVLSARSRNVFAPSQIDEIQFTAPHEFFSIRRYVLDVHRDVEDAVRSTRVNGQERLLGASSRVSSVEHREHLLRAPYVHFLQTFHRDAAFPILHERVFHLTGRR